MPLPFERVYNIDEPDPNAPKTPVSVRLIGEDGNVFFIMGKVSREMRTAGYSKEAKAFKEECQRATSYDGILQLVCKYVTVL